MKPSFTRLLVIGAVQLQLLNSLLWGAGQALPIRNRIQWLENSGYCGEQSLQECALYFGVYASQAYIRAIYDPTQQNDLVELEEWQQVVPFLGLKAEYFPTTAVPEPQFMVYSAWIKRQLIRGYPVIGTCYLRGGASTDPVDHIITITGFAAESLTKYHPEDSFTFNHHLGQVTEGLPGAPQAFAQNAKWLFDDRAMNESGKVYGYAFQKERNYGLAVTGTTNRSPLARPVRLELESLTEPNLIAGEQPVDLKVTVTVERLTIGTSYVLYRYDDPAKVPTSDYQRQPSTKRIAFKATQRGQTFTETIPSNGVAIFRCLPAGQ